MLLAVMVFADSGRVGAGESVYHCRPAHAVFCRNIYVSCSGVTDIRMTPFTVSIADGSAHVDFHGAPAPVRGVVSGRGDLVIRLENSRDWIRIQTDGQYSHRIRRPRGDAMSRGYCERAPER
jgi:hypothetical protein